MKVKESSRHTLKTYKLENIEKMNKILDTYDLPKLN